ncbi:MAG: L,D-transpeptidase [Clostridiaceae bacterium]|nr:L,D-transpeptidase [Clostridiaceae bacterium]
MKRYFLTVLIVFVCFSQVSADSKLGKARIEINIPSRTLSLYKDDILFKEYPVCVGKQSTQTPQGEYRVIYKTVNPYWVNKDVVVPPGPRNPLGVRWIGITKGIGIHGNNKPESIGTYASAGCIRMYNRDVEEVYTLVPVNSPVAIRYDRSKVFEDEYSGEKAVIIYPDSYKKGVGSSKQLLEKLSQMDIHEELNANIQEILTKPISKTLAVSQGIGVFLNNSLVTCDAREEQGEIYVNYRAAEDVLGLTSGIAGFFDIGIKELDGRIYINLTQTVKSFGGSMNYDEVSGNAYISMKIIKVNGTFAGINYGDCDKSDFLSVEAVKQLEYGHSEDSVDLRIFDKGIMKLKRKNIWVVNVDNLTEILGGYKNISSRDGVADLKLPTFLRLGEEYFKTDNIDGRLVLNVDIANSIHERSGWAAEAFSVSGDNAIKNIDLESFLEDYDYAANNFGTVIDVKVKEK